MLRPQAKTFLCWMVSLYYVKVSNCYMDRCLKSVDVSILWSKHIGTQFIASPVVDDITLDDGLEILAQTQSGDLTLLQGMNGEHIEDTSWPVKVNIGNLHSSSLLYDVNKDGIKDIITISTEGDIRVYSILGKVYPEFSSKLEDIFIEKNWFEKQSAPIKTVADFRTMNGIIIDKLPGGVKLQNYYIKLNPHVFATGVIEDINNDKVVEELVLPVTFMLDDDEMARNQNSSLDSNDLHLLYSKTDYLATAVVIFNLTSFKVQSKYYTELDKRTSEFPPYALSSPLIVNYHKDTSVLPQILLPTSGLKISRINMNGKEDGSAIMTKGITEQVLVEDLSFDEKNRLEFIYSETGRLVVCTDSTNRKVWETDVKEDVTGIRLFERKTVDGALVKIVVVATTAAKIWLLNGQDGKPLPKWPSKLGRELRSPPNIVQLIHDGPIYIAVLDTDGHLHMMTVDQRCRFSVEIGETTKLGFVVADLVPEIPGLELLIATTHGSLIAVGINKERLKNGYLLEHGVTQDMYNSSFLSLYSWPAESKSHNVFMHSGRTGCFITDVTGYPGGHIDLDFSLVDHSEDSYNPSRMDRGLWSAAVYIGNKLASEVIMFQPFDKEMETKTQTSRNLHLGSHTVSLKTDRISDMLHLEVRCYQHYRQLYSHMVAFKLEQTWSKDMILLFLMPFVFMLLVFFIDGLMSQKRGSLLGGTHLD